MRQAIKRGLIERRAITPEGAERRATARRVYTYHLNPRHRAEGPSISDGDGQPVQIIVPVGAARAPIKTTAPASVFHMGGISFNERGAA